MRHSLPTIVFGTKIPIQAASPVRLLFSYFVVPVSSGMGDCSENINSNGLGRVYVIPTPAEGGEESRATARAKHETPHSVRSDMAAHFRRPWCWSQPA